MICERCGGEYPNRGFNLHLRHCKGPHQEAFWACVDRSNDCWEWTRLRVRGYGIVWNGERQVKAHRFVWEMVYGPIPEGLYICHHCDNKACVKPTHLFLGTQADNMKDMVEKGRQALHRGEENGRSKIPASDISKIRQRVIAGEQESKIAKEYGVHRVTIKAIKDRVRWSHVPEHGPNWKETHA